jgi:aminoglycoside phosphotransferase family enzyme
MPRCRRRKADRHFKAKTRALGALRSYFTRERRRIYLSAELPLYYPAEPRLAPDLLAVLDVEDAERDKWVVSAEGKGLDWVLEVHVGGGPSVAPFLHWSKSLSGACSR